LGKGSAEPKEIEVGGANEFVNDVARAHEGSYIGVGVKWEQYEKGLGEPDVGDHFVIGHRLGLGGRSIEGFEDHDADEAPEELGAKTGEGGGSVLEECAEASAEHGDVGF